MSTNLNPSAQLKHHGELLRVLLMREVHARTSGTVLGIFWMLLQPTLQVVALWFLLQVVLRVRFPELPGGFIQYFLVGMLPWLMLTEVLTRSLSVLQEYASIYERTPFPIGLIPLLPLMVSGVIYTTIYLVISLIFGGASGLIGGLIFMAFALLWLLPLIYLLAIIGLFVRDLQHIVPFILTMLLYLTPILYTPAAMPEALHWWLLANPFAHLISLAHVAVDGGIFPSTSLLGLIFLWFILLVPAWLLWKRAEPFIREAL